MSDLTLKQMEDDWTLKMAARNSRGQRLFEIDARYRNDVTALGVQIAERKKAEAATPQISQDQLDWLNRAQGATDKDGRRLTENPAYAKGLREAREKVFAGGDIAGMTLGVEGAKLGPEFAQPTARQRALAHEAGFSLGVHHSVGGGVGTIATNTTPATA